MSAIAGKALGRSPVRTKQKLLLSILIGLVLLISVFAAIVSSPAKEVKTVEQQVSSVKAFGMPADRVDKRDTWRVQEGARVDEIRRKQKEQDALIAQLKAQLDAVKAKELAAEAKRAEDAKKKPPFQEMGGVGPPSAGLPPQTAPLGQPDGLDFAGGRAIKGIVRVDLGNASAAPNSAGKGGIKQEPNSGRLGGAAGSHGQTADNYLPAGTFTGGVLLSGLDAPTGGQVQQNPHPILIELLDLASLPNRFKSDYKHCRITGNGVGDLSSERAYIRLDRMSCVREDGGAIDIAVKGFIAGSDGKAGIRGRLVSKQGQVLGNALLAGVASGIGTAFAQNAVTTSVSPLGATQTLKNGEQYKAGLGQGVNSAMQRLAEYYISLADQLFPVIEVDAGQRVDIVFTQGIDIARK